MSILIFILKSVKLYTWFMSSEYPNKQKYIYIYIIFNTNF